MKLTNLVSALTVLMLFMIITPSIHYSSGSFSLSYTSLVEAKDTVGDVEINDDDDEEAFDEDDVEEVPLKQHLKPNAETLKKNQNFEDQDEEEGSSQAESKENDVLPPKPLFVPKTMPPFTLDNYFMEVLSLMGVFAYGINYLMGKSKNTKIAKEWGKINHTVLDENFAMVGERGVLLMKESQSEFSCYCSGRINCEYMSISLDLVKRHDLLSLAMNILQPMTDKITFSIEMDSSCMDSFVLAVGPKKRLVKQKKDLQDLAFFASPHSAESLGLPSTLAVYTDCMEVAREIFTKNTVDFLKENINLFDSIHFSDKYVGKVDPDATERPTAKRALFLTFNVPSIPNMEKSLLFTKLALHLVDKVAKTRLSPLAKAKADKRRAQLEEEYAKLAHSARQEEIQKKKEEELRKKREQMQQMDPEARRKLEEKDRKRELKKMQQKIKVR